jgi:hypothetical protein
MAGTRRTRAPDAPRPLPGFLSRPANTKPRALFPTLGGGIRVGRRRVVWDKVGHGACQFLVPDLPDQPECHVDPGRNTSCRNQIFLRDVAHIVQYRSILCMLAKRLHETPVGGIRRPEVNPAPCSSEATPLMDAAFNAAWRAVEE